VLKPIDFSRLEAALTGATGWLELAVVALCVGLAWLIDHRLYLRARAADVRVTRLRAGIGRVVFPLLGLLLLLIARYAFKRWAGAPFFIDIAMPLLIALAAIRLLVYGMRRLFANQSWLKTSERAIGFTVWGLAVLWFIGALPEITRELDQITLPLGDSSITVLTVIKGTLAVILTLIVTLWLSGLIEQRLLATSIDTNVKAVLGKLLRAALLVAGVLFALNAIGFDLTVFAVFGGALGVGIGLGLQKLAANYIAGFTILIDKSIRLGDLITVDNRHGVVSRVTSRYVVVRSVDGIEAIVPNETLATTTILHHPHPGNEFRQVISVQVAYDTDVPAAMQLMTEAARGEASTVTDTRPPVVLLGAFGDSGITLEMIFWVRNPPAGPGVARTAVSNRVLAAFRQHGIAIPYPRRDLWVVGRDAVTNAAQRPEADQPAAGPN
jgi:small-conductance mechanosensitive channel